MFAWSGKQLLPHKPRPRDLSLKTLLSECGMAILRPVNNFRNDGRIRLTLVCCQRRPYAHTNRHHRSFVSCCVPRDAQIAIQKIAVFLFNRRTTEYPLENNRMSTNVLPETSSAFCNSNKASWAYSRGYTLGICSFYGVFLRRDSYRTYFNAGEFPEFCTMR